MPIARIALGFWTHPKRIKLERLLAGHDWASARGGDPRCAGECVCRVLAWLDGLGDVSGAIPSPDEAEEIAGWRGEPGALYAALEESGFVEEGAWHDFGHLNGITLIRREAGRRGGLAGSANMTPEQRSERARKAAAAKHTLATRLANSLASAKQAANGSGSGSGSGSGDPESPTDLSFPPEPGTDADEPLVLTADPDRYMGGPIWNGAGLAPHGLVALWNAVAEDRGLPVVRSLSDARLRKAKGALKEEARREVWEAAFDAMASDPFLVGKNQAGKVYATFDYAIRPEKRGVWLDQARAGEEVP